jgi:hypothetical protein
MAAKNMTVKMATLSLWGVTRSCNIALIRLLRVLQAGELGTRWRSCNANQVLIRGVLQRLFTSYLKTVTTIIYERSPTIRQGGGCSGALLSHNTHLPVPWQ